MDEPAKPTAQMLGSAWLVLSILLVENLRTTSGQQSWLTLRVVEAGFALFLVRTILALRPVGPWLARRHAALRWGLGGALALALLWQDFWVAILVLSALLFAGGILTAEFVDDVARAAARPPALARRHPLAAALVLLPFLAFVTLLHFILARGAYLVWPDSALPSGFASATFALGLATLLGVGLLALALRGRGREHLPRRILYLAAFGYAAGWLFGYVTADTAAVHDATGIPLIALAIVLVECIEILFEAPERLASGRRAIPREALWDLFLAIAFGTLTLFISMDIGGFALRDAVFGIKSIGWMGLAAGALLVPLARWHARKHEAANGQPSRAENEDGGTEAA